ncbi:MAG: Gfo/Idh/MocA family oxidoreductase [Planctomycetes bacterium]|nr:Gfo/Idh/MocA family oxidoreductase [Planctomycetota bacterium]
MTKIARRSFLGGAALGAASLAFPHLALARGGKRWRPNDEVRVAVIGLRGRGVDHVNGLHGLDGVRVVALCDCDSAVLERERKRFTDRGERVDVHADLRDVLAREDVDAVSIATPNHWHALAAVWACQAGKDVYVEKPVSHSVWEGRQIVRAARKYGRVVQTGTQSRSSHAIAEAIAWLRKGELGAITHAQGLCYKPRRPIGKVDGPQPVPASVDYDLWLGPAPDAPLLRKNLHYDWHWDFATGNGDLGNQGIHQMDLCRWALGHRGLSSRVVSLGGRLGYDDDGDTPNTLVTLHEFAAGPPILFEVRGLPVDAASQRAEWAMDKVRGVSVGAWIHCEGGALRLPNYQEAQAYDADGALVQEWKGATSHYANFVEAVRSRRVEDLHADIEEGHVSSALCHTGNASWLCGVAAEREELRELVAGRGPAADAVARMSAHLAANGVDLSAACVTAGAVLEVDPQSERFTNSPAANRLLRRPGRGPFTLPEEV